MLFRAVEIFLPLSSASVPPFKKRIILAAGRCQQLDLGQWTAILSFYWGRLSMSDVFEKRVRAAAVAGWWTLLIDVGFLLIQWIAYRLAMSVHPAWLLSFWYGPDTTWSFVQTVWFWGIAIMKICVWPLALVTLWLTLWARQLRKRADA